eukprot:3603303-Heterocapsa_arctica.AAC.1
MLKDKIDKLTDTSSKMMQENLEETVRTRNIMEETVGTLRGSARPELEKPVDTEKEKEKEEQRIRGLKKTCDDQDRIDRDNQRDAKLAAEERLKQDQENAAQAKLNEQQKIQEEQMKTLDTQEMN